MCRDRIEGGQSGRNITIQVLYPGRGHAHSIGTRGTGRPRGNVNEVGSESHDAGAGADLLFPKGNSDSRKLMRT